MKQLFTILLLSFASLIYAQTGSISGKIVDEKNQPLEGVIISIKNTTMPDAKAPLQVTVNIFTLFSLASFGNDQGKKT